MTGSGQALSVEQRLAAIHRRIALACARVGRSPREVTVVGASKGQPLERLGAARASGLADFGENRVQEAETKHGRLNDVRWHLLGPLQSNKARRAAELFDVIHSLDRLKIGRLLDREARDLGRRLDCFVEVNLGREASKHGFLPEALEQACAELLALEHLRLLGLMAIPPAGDLPEDSRSWFRQLQVLCGRLKQRHPELPGALSMGMSSDFEIAIEEGATHVRIGTELFGPRRSSSS